MTGAVQNIQLTSDQVDDLRREMKEAGEWVREQIKTNREKPRAAAEPSKNVAMDEQPDIDT